MFHARFDGCLVFLGPNEPKWINCFIKRHIRQKRNKKKKTTRNKKQENKKQEKKKKNKIKKKKKKKKKQQKKKNMLLKNDKEKIMKQPGQHFNRLETESRHREAKQYYYENLAKELKDTNTNIYSWFKIIKILKVNYWYTNNSISKTWW